MSEGSNCNFLNQISYIYYFDYPFEISDFSAKIETAAKRPHGGGVLPLLSSTSTFASFSNSNFTMACIRKERAIANKQKAIKHMYICRRPLVGYQAAEVLHVCKSICSLSSETSASSPTN